MVLRLGILLFFALQAALWSMPPAPGVIELLAEEGRLDQLRLQMADARQRGVNAPFAYRAQEPRDGADEVVVRALCILADFEDNEADRQAFPAERYQEMLFSRGEYRTGSMRDWFLENSYGEIDIQGEVYGWYRMPQTYEWYVQNRRGFGDFPRNAQGLVRDALAAANEDVNYRDFDNDGDGVVEALFVVHAGPGAESTGRDDQIWSHAWTVPQNVIFDGKRFARYAMEPEDGKIGVFGHELGHSYFGLPDLYDTDYSSAGVGMWSMMSGGSWGGGGNRPVHFDAWCKYKIGALDPLPIIRNHRALVVNPVETEPDVLMLWRENDWDDQYFLLENRTNLGFDASLPAHGIMIWHIDEDMDGNADEWYPGQNPARHLKVALEQADGRWDLEHDSNSGDGGDPYPGFSWNTLFTSGSTPDSRDYRNNPTWVTVHNIEASDSIRYRIDITLDRDWQPETPRVLVLNRVPPDHRYPHPDRRDGNLTDEMTMVEELLHNAGLRDYDVSDQLTRQLGAYNTILYLESWREGEELQGGLTREEQGRLAEFLTSGGRLILIGPDVAANLSRYEDSPLLPLLGMEFIDDGPSAEENRARVMNANAETRIAGQNFPLAQRSPATDRMDVVGAAEGAGVLFTDNLNQPRGVIAVGVEGGYRVVLQPFLFGALVDWGGEKVRLMQLYFSFMQFALSAPSAGTPVVPTRALTIDAFPNPFNASLTLQVSGRVTSGAALSVFDALGRKVGALSVNSPSGRMQWRPEGLPAGIYWLRLDGGALAPATRVVYLR